MPKTALDRRKSTDFDREEPVYPSAPPSYAGPPPSYESFPQDSQQENYETDDQSLRPGRDRDGAAVCDPRNDGEVQDRPGHEKLAGTSSMPSSKAVSGGQVANEPSHRKSSFNRPSLRSFSLSAVTPPSSLPQIASPIDTAGAGGDNDRRLPETIRASLRRLAKIRMKALRYRTAEREENMHIRNLHKRVVGELYVFLTAIEKLKKTIQPDILQNIGDWDDFIVNIEDYIEESEAAGKRSDRKHEQLDKLEWDLRVREDELYAPHHSRTASNSIDNDINLSAADEEDFGTDPPSSGAHPPDMLDEPDVIDDFLALSKPIPEQGIEDYEDDEIEGDEYVMLSGASDELGLFANELSQFADQQSVNWSEQKASFMLESHFPGADLERITQWMLYGRPWSDRLGSQTAAACASASASRSTIEALCRWIWEHLNLLTTGVSASAQTIRNTNLQDIDFIEFKSFFINNWLGESNVRPIAQNNTGPEAAAAAAGLSETRILGGIDATNDIGNPQAHPVEPTSPRTNAAVDDDTVATNSAHSRLRQGDSGSAEMFLRKTALSEQSQSYVGRSDFPGYHNKVRRDSLP